MFTARCLAGPTLSATTNAPNPCGRIKPPLSGSVLGTSKTDVLCEQVIKSPTNKIIILMFIV